MARILVIDDDELFVKLMCHSLRQHGHSVEFALDGHKGCKAFDAGAFDIVVCDIVMPEQEGLATIKRLRTLNADVGIIAISGGLSRSGGTNLDVLDLVGKLGADATLRKPFPLSELVAAVNRILSPQKVQAV